MPYNYRVSSVVPPTAISTFRVDKLSSTSGKQAKYSPKRRQEVKLMREKRACLRCSLLRISCSYDDICTPCQKLALASYEKRILSFCACIRTRLVEVSIFDDFVPSPDNRNSLLEKSRFLALHSITLDFSSLITWDLTNLVHEIVEWLNNPKLSTTSKVGILSSPEFLHLVGSYVSDEIGVNFQRMLYAESLAYTQPTTNDKHHLSVSELHQIGAIAGHNILIFLDRKLKPESLRNCSKQGLKAIFLLLIGTILAVSYVYPDVKDDIVLNEKTHSKDPGYCLQFQAMQNHLCQILATNVVYLGSKLCLLPVASYVEKFILEAATNRWHKEGIFHWSTSPEYGPGIDRLVEADNSICDGIFSSLNVNTITPTQLSEPSNSECVYDSSPCQNLLNLELAGQDSLWDDRSPLHHQDSKLLSPLDEDQGTIPSLAIISQNNSLPLQPSHHSLSKYGHIDGLERCSLGLHSCSNGVMRSNKVKEYVKRMATNLGGKLTKTTGAWNQWVHRQPQHTELEYLNNPSFSLREAKHPSQAGYFCPRITCQMWNPSRKDGLKVGSAERRCLYCGQRASYDGNVSSEQGLKYPASGLTDTSKGKGSNFDSGLLTVPSYHEYVWPHLMETNTNLPKYWDCTDEIYHGSQKTQDEAVFGNAESWTSGLGQVEAAPAAEFPYLELCPHCSGEYMNGRCANCGEFKRIPHRAAKPRQNLLV